MADSARFLLHRVDTIATTEHDRRRRRHRHHRHWSDPVLADRHRLAAGAAAAPAAEEKKEEEEDEDEDMVRRRNLSYRFAEINGICRASVSSTKLSLLIPSVLHCSCNVLYSIAIITHGCIPGTIFVLSSVHSDENV